MEGDCAPKIYQRQFRRHGFNFDLAMAALATSAGIGRNLRSSFFLKAICSAGVMSSKCVRAVDRMNRMDRILKLRRTSEVETTDDADDADKQELGGETGRMSPKHALQMEPVYHP